MDRPWQVTNEKVEAAIGRIVQLCRPRRIIVFGSYVWGETDVDSDLDILIVAREPVSNPRKESVRIRRELKGMRMPMGILVIRRCLISFDACHYPLEELAPPRRKDSPRPPVPPRG